MEDKIKYSHKKDENLDQKANNISSNITGADTKTDTNTNQNNISDHVKITKRSYYYKNSYKKNISGDDHFRDLYNKDIKTIILLKRRVSYTVAGGKRGRIAVVAASYNSANNTLGIGKAKSRQYFLAIQKAEMNTRKKLIKIKNFGSTIPHEVKTKYKSVKILMYPSRNNRGLISGSIARKIFKLIDIKNITCKIFGRSKSGYNVIYAVIKALSSLETIKDIQKRRNIK